MNRSRAIARAVSHVLFKVTPGGARHRALSDLRRWELHKARYRKERMAAANAWILAARAARGAFAPWNLGNVATLLRTETTKRVVELMSWLVAAERMTTKRGVRMCHRNVSHLLGCSERTAGSTVRAAVAAGYLDRCPWFAVDALSQRRQRECVYQLTPAFRAILETAKVPGKIRSLLASKKCQPSRIQRSPSASSVKRSAEAGGGIDCTGVVYPAPARGASSIAPVGPAQCAGEAPEGTKIWTRATRQAHDVATLRSSLPVPATLASVLDAELLPEIAAAMAAYDRRFGGQN